MGTYDDIHGGKYCGQVKCLGKALRQIVPGMEVELYVFAAGLREDEILEELELYVERGGNAYDAQSPQHLLFDGERSEIANWQIRMDIGFCVFMENRFIKWSDTPEEGLMVVGNAGREGVDPDSALFLTRPGCGALAGDCPICAQLRKDLPLGSEIRQRAV
jgi:hypothetical protein